MKISSKGLILIEDHERCVLVSYICPAGKMTVGIGHTRTAKYGMTITREQAYELLKSDVAVCEAVINRHLPNLNQNQFDALVSFVFNIGGPNFTTSTLLKKIKGHSPESEIRTEFAKWKYGGNGESNGKDDDGDGLIDEKGEKKLQPGLITRRKEEADLYFSS
jgi:lysozyme